MTPSGSRSMPFETARGSIVRTHQVPQCQQRVLFVGSGTVFEPYSSRAMERGLGRP